MPTDTVAGKNIQEVLPGGPQRVVVTFDGEAVNPRRAREQYMTNPTIIFIRDDGWSLAAPEHLEAVALSLWRDNWVGFVRKPNQIIQPMSEYSLFTRKE